VYVYYGLDVAGVRPEDLPYFVSAREYRLEKLHEHEGRYYLRFPEYLRVIPKNVENDFGVPSNFTSSHHISVPIRITITGDDYGLRSSFAKATADTGERSTNRPS
jgi:hypothetical protein